MYVCANICAYYECINVCIFALIDTYLGYCCAIHDGLPVPRILPLNIVLLTAARQVGYVMSRMPEFWLGIGV